MDETEKNYIDLAQKEVAEITADAEEAGIILSPEDQKQMLLWEIVLVKSGLKVN